MNYINRNMEKIIRTSIGAYPAIMVTGPRQVGKTTMLNYIAQKSRRKIHYVTLDDMAERQQANTDPQLFLESHGTPLVIDEFQYAPNLLSYIKIRIDQARQNELFGDQRPTGTLYYLTGSQSFHAMKNVSESLAGRIAIFDLFTLSHRELSGAKTSLFTPDIATLKRRTPTSDMTVHDVYQKILLGGYPRLYGDQAISREQYFRDYLNTYIERDIRQLINVKDENKFIRFVTSVAARTAQEFNATEIGNEIEINSKTVSEWLSILKNTGIIYTLQPYTNNRVSRAIKRPKIYFMDTGLACFLAGYLDATTLERSAFNGPIFETYVVSEIIKSFANNGRDPRRHLYYYRDTHQKEIDLLILDQQKIYPIEIKKTASPSLHTVKNFSVVDKLEIPSGNGGVICLGNELRAIAENIWQIPVEYI